MALKLNVKPGERIFITGGTLQIATQGTIPVVVEGRVTLVRETDYLPKESASSPARRLVWALQEAYLTGNVEIYADEIGLALAALPAPQGDAKQFAIDVNSSLIKDDIFKALKSARLLVLCGEHFTDWPALVGFKGGER